MPNVFFVSYIISKPKIGTTYKYFKGHEKNLSYEGFYS